MSYDDNDGMVRTNNLAIARSPHSRQGTGWKSGQGPRHVHTRERKAEADAQSEAQATLRERARVDKRERDGVVTTARWARTCGTCGLGIEVGSEMRWVPSTKACYHHDCNAL